MPWPSEFGSVFMLAVMTGVCGGVGLLLKFALRMKCATFKCCFGAIDLVRDITAEEQIEEAQLALARTTRQGSRESPAAGGISQKTSANGFSTPPSPMPGGVVLNRM